MKKCKTCKWFLRGRAAPGAFEIESRCQRYPPAAVEVDGEQYYRWPVVYKQNFCGEHKRKSASK